MVDQIALNVMVITECLKDKIKLLAEFCKAERYDLVNLKDYSLAYSRGVGSDTKFKVGTVFYSTLDPQERKMVKRLDEMIKSVIFIGLKAFELNYKLRCKVILNGSPYMIERQAFPIADAEHGYVGGVLYKVLTDASVLHEGLSWEVSGHESLKGKDKERHGRIQDAINYIRWNLSEKVTKREFEIVELLGKGFNSFEIGERLFISKHTVDKHRQNLLKKFNAQNTTQLVAALRANPLMQ